MNHNFTSLLRRRPSARAIVTGGMAYPSIFGEVLFYETDVGVMVTAEFSGLPRSASACEGHFFGFHIHEGGSCGGDANDPHSHAGTHYNPTLCEHPNHAGDLPPILGAGGRAFSAFLTDRFTVHEIIGRTVVLHASPDDFTTQPAGNSGRKIACGVISER